jgi:hypothetical protein
LGEIEEANVVRREQVDVERGREGASEIGIR